MNYINSSDFFEISNEPGLPNTFRSRLFCLKDFLKRCFIFPFALLVKAYKTLGRFIGICLGLTLVLATLGASCGARKYFVEKVINFAKDVADWVLLPIALILCFFKLLLALFVHPNFYFSS